MKLSQGKSETLGATLDDKGCNFAVASTHATAVELCLFDATGEHETARVTLPGRTGEIHHGHVEGVVAGTRYGLRAHGAWAPAAGHRFSPSKLLIDPYARQLDRIPRLDPSMFGMHDDGSMDDADSAAAMPKGIVTAPILAADGNSLTPWPKTVIYELHVRGFTMRHPDIPPELRGTFAGLAHPAAIAHLRALGVTAVEVLPPCAWIEERHLHAQGITNYWGYNSIAFLAPDPRLAPGGWDEVRSTVATLAAAGIETLVDIVLNHTGEGDDLGPILSLRGLDNATYFRANGAVDVNDSGCGNTLALDRPLPLRLAMDSLRAWARYGGVHGFRFDLAPILARRSDGFDPLAPLLQAIEQDPLLSRLKMIAEPWDAGWGGYQLGRFPPRWGEWNDRFRDAVRQFWSGTPSRLGPLATRLAGSADIFGGGRMPSRSLNFVVAHDGFALADLVSYADKHNAANGEFNRDGTNDNFSWNNGAEGETVDPRIHAARQADQRALLATLLLARGTPMLWMGSELGQTQGGNNNPYAQDNETTWLDWARADPDLLAWTRRLIALRRDHAGFHADQFLTDADAAWLHPDGHPMQSDDWNAQPGDALIMLMGAPRLVLAFNRGAVPITVDLPPPEPGHVWRRLADSARCREPELVLADDRFELSARSVVVLAEAPGPSGRPARAADPEVLGSLARAAGIAAEWWEVHGTHHRTADDTTRAILKAMRLPADTTGEARDSLASLADTRDRRFLPQALVRRTGETVSLAMTLQPGLSPRTGWLQIEREDGTVLRVRAGAANAAIDSVTACDGQPLRRWSVRLPELPIGRHRVRHDDLPDCVCHLTIAPQTAYLPPALHHGQRRFGVSAQLYSLHRDGDQGVGDFTTLRELSLATRGAGGGIVGLNPMHAMFAAERDRASPYQPSDRRFLDPAYLDLPEAGRAAAPALIAWRDVWARKSAVLERMFGAGQQAPGLQAFIDHAGLPLAQFATFEAIAETRPGQNWQTWPEQLRDPASSADATFAREHPERIRFHQWLQFQCETQLANAAVPHQDGGLEIGLIRDLAVGCAPDGAEAWAMGERMATGVSIGAPPDPLGLAGQVWGLPPPNPLLMAQDGYAGFGHLLEANMRHAGGLRIDHALGLARLFWVPDGATALDGTYVAYPFDDLLGQLALCSTRAKALVIGEDLGTVPDGFREVLQAHDVLSYKVLLLERDGRGFKPRDAYPQRAIACVSTHDLPTFAGWRAGCDIAERVALGHRSVQDAAADSAEREAEVAALQDAIGPGDLAALAHAAIAATKCDLVYVQADDLAGETVAVNLPGTDRERPNWRRRLKPPLDELFDTDVARPILDALRRARPAD